MTRLALSLSGYVNGVARMHADTTAQMFPGHSIDAVTNGVHLETWAHDAFARLFSARFPHWRQDPATLVGPSRFPATRCGIVTRPPRAT